MKKYKFTKDFKNDRYGKLFKKDSICNIKCDEVYDEDNNWIFDIGSDNALKYGEEVEIAELVKKEYFTSNESSKSSTKFKDKGLDLYYNDLHNLLGWLEPYHKDFVNKVLNKKRYD